MTTGACYRRSCSRLEARRRAAPATCGNISGLRTLSCHRAERHHAMTDYQAAKEAGLAAKFAAVGLIGFGVDALLLRIGLSFGLSIAAARFISLTCAMQVTFAINGLHVFRCLTRAKVLGRWAGYMTTNGFGNLCNFWIFITLVSLHRPV